MKIKSILLGSVLSLAIAAGFANQVLAAPIHTAAWCGDVEAAQLELANGADVNAKDDYDRTALMWAAEFGHKKVVEHCFRILLLRSMLRIELDGLL